jgi:Ankyrin repeats (3 copies)
MPHLPENPSLDHLRRQARTLLRQFRTADAEALALLRKHHPHPHDPLRLADSQLVVARSYGFPSWPALRRHMDAVGRFARSPHTVAPRANPADELLRLGCVRYGGDSRADHARAADLLVDHPELSGATIHTAAATGDEAAAQGFLTRDAAAANRTGGPFDWPPLLYLAYSRIGGDALPVARLLLDHGADPDAGYLWEGTYPFTALTGAFGGGEDRGNQPPHPQGLALARMLLEAGADPNDSQTLYNRQFEPDDAHLRLLIEFGLGHDRSGPWHRLLGSYHGTPAQLLDDQLSYAAHYGRPSWALLALAAGADPDGRGTEHPIFHGGTPYQLAVHRGNLEVAELLRAAGATAPPLDDVELFLAAAMAGDRAAVERLRTADPDIVSRARPHRPDAVLVATEVGHAAAVRLLVELGYELHCEGRLTPLHQAAYDGDTALVTLLLELGADPTRRDAAFNATPLGWAEHNHQEATAALLRPLTPS